MGTFDGLSRINYINNRSTTVRCIAVPYNYTPRDRTVPGIYTAIRDTRYYELVQCIESGMQYLAAPSFVIVDRRVVTYYEQRCWVGVGPEHAATADDPRG